MDPPEKCHMRRDTAVFDWLLLGVAIAAIVPFIFANGVIFQYRRRKFFQLQGGVWLILGSSMAGVIWIMSCFVVNSHFRRRDHRILRLCTLWTFWLHGTFGPCLWFSCVLLRLYRFLHASTSNMKVLPGWKCCLYLVLSLLPALALSIAASFSRAFEDHRTPGGAYKCALNSKFKVLAWIVMVTPYLCVYVLLLIRLRKFTRTGNPVLVMEYMDTSEYFLMACVILVLNWITYRTKGHLQVPGRCFLTFCECSLVFSHFWVRFGHPVYLCLFRPISEMDDFENELNICLPQHRSLEAVYRQRSMNFSSSEGAVFEAVTKATHELETHKAKIRELEQQKASLKAQLRRAAS